VRLAREADLQRTILDYLRLHRIFHWRSNSGKVRVKGGWVKLAPKGSPDIFAVPKGDGRLLGIEVKMPGEVQSEEQKAFQRAMETAGCDYVVVYDVSDLEEVEVVLGIE
jgi:hypothetical protein